MSTELKRAAQRAERPIAPAAWPEIELGASDRILVLAPHPDDESLACGGVIQRALSSGLPVHVLFLTLGDNNEWSFMVYRKRPELLPWQVRAMGEVRHGEALAAARVLGLPPDALTFLGYPDFGTLRIWCSHWGDAPPFRSMLTRVTSVPYENAYRRGAAYKGDEIVRDLAAVIARVSPDPDLRLASGRSQPRSCRALPLHPDRPLGPGRRRFARRSIHSSSTTRAGPVRAAWSKAPPSLRPSIWPALRLDVLRLTEDEVSRKEAALQAHQTQYGYCRTYLDSFVRTDELYGDFEDVRLPRAGLRRILSGT